MKIEDLYLKCRLKKERWSDEVILEVLISLFYGRSAGNHEVDYLMAVCAV